MYPNKINAKGIFLDLDGTIVDSTGAYIEAARLAYQSLGQKLPELQVVLEIPRRIEQRLSIDDLTQDKTRQFMAVYLHAYYSITEAKTRLFPNVCKTLQTLSGKAKLALITMRHVPKQVIYKELDYFGISNYFTHIVTALDTSEPKPSPEALLQCVKTLDLEICDCLMAGDSVNDVRAGKAAGATTVAVLSGLFYKEELAKEHPDLIIPNVTSLPDNIA